MAVKKKKKSLADCGGGFLIIAIYKAAAGQMPRRM